MYSFVVPSSAWYQGNNNATKQSLALL